MSAGDTVVAIVILEVEMVAVMGSRAVTVFVFVILEAVVWADSGTDCDSAGSGGEASYRTTQIRIGRIGNDLLDVHTRI